MVDRRKAFSFICTRDHCQRFSPSWIFGMPRSRFEPAQNLSSCLIERSCGVEIRVAKNWGARERGSHEIKTCRTKCDPGCKKHYRRKNICSGTNIENAQNENICRCVTYICIYPQETSSIIWGKNYVLNLGVAANVSIVSRFNL